MEAKTGFLAAYNIKNGVEMERSMKWTKFKIKTLTQAEDIVISTLYDIGLEGAQIEDKVPLSAAEKEQMFVDILPENGEDDGIAYLSFFVEVREDGMLEVNGENLTVNELLEKVKAELEDLRMFMDIGEGTVQVDETEDIDWINNWKEYFHQFYIDDILVIPSWEEVKAEDKDKMVLHIDPAVHPPAEEIYNTRNPPVGRGNGKRDIVHTFPDVWCRGSAGNRFRPVCH